MNTLTLPSVALVLLGSVAMALEPVQSVTIGAFKVPVQFSRRNIRKYTLDSSQTATESPPITDPAILKILWPKQDDSYRWDTANGKTYFYAIHSGDTVFQEFSLAYFGGCEDVQYFVLTKSGAIRGRIPLAESCASDAEDNSFGAFIKPGTYEKTSTWVDEEPEPGKDPSHFRKCRFTIAPDGSVTQKTLREQ